MAIKANGANQDSQRFGFFSWTIAIDLSIMSPNMDITHARSANDGFLVPERKNMSLTMMCYECAIYVVPNRENRFIVHPVGT